MEKALLSLISVFWKLFILIHEYKNIFSKRKIFRQVQLTPAQKKQIDEFYLENYGKKIPYWWHRLYQSYTGKFDHQYIPEIVFSTRIEPETNDRIKVFQFESKNMISVLFGHVEGIRLPCTFLFRCEGCFYDKDRGAISEKAAIATLSAQSEEPLEAVIKKAVDSGSGRGGVSCAFIMALIWSAVKSWSRSLNGWEAISLFRRKLFSILRLEKYIRMQSIPSA